MLPEQFLARMKRMLGEEYAAFLDSYEKPEAFSLRVNSLKGSGQELAERTDFLTKRVPWAKDGFYYREDARPGKHPYHEAGAYYIQEASAMAPAAFLGAQPGERILDLCAAPGGKSTYIGADLRGQGLLVCNEIHPTRARILSENVERMGIRNALVMNHEPAYLAERFPDFFDRILVDAPCSGEGMFRKSQEAREQWSPENVEGCAGRQADILDQAALMLRPGGRMIYSTCTFSPEENEGAVAAFLAGHPEFELEPLKKFSGMVPGELSYLTGVGAELPADMGNLSETDIAEGTVRLWPHRLKGEGHFVACLRKSAPAGFGGTSFYRKEQGVPEKEYGSFLEFQKQYLRTSFSGVFVRFGEQLYLLPQEAPALKGLKVLRPGLHLGTFRKERFEPAHALALALKPQDAKSHLALSDDEARRYIRGETLAAQGEKGWYLLTAGGYSLGWGKLAGGIMKNHYPKGLRK